MPRAILLLALLAGGCVSASEVRHRTTRIGRAVRPALRQMKEDSRRLVRAAGQAADDAALAARVKAVMLTRSGLDARQVSVSAEDGTVRLSGRVPTPTQKHQVARLARDTVGVKGVENCLRVGPTD